jgi:glucose/arabinose dehydrogenase/cytochrome c2
MTMRLPVGSTVLLLTGAWLLGGCHSSDATGGSDEVSQGRALFVQRCAVCHSTGGQGAQGPGLGGVVGRQAASAPGFGYTAAMRSSGLTWDRATLDRFLTAPSALVPGTTMPIPVPAADERRELIAYLATLPATPSAKPSATSSGTPPPVAAPGALTGTAAFGSYRRDGPGVRRHLTVADLPPPFGTESARNSPSVVSRPSGALLHVPAGFAVDLFASDLKNPRIVRVAPNGDIFVAETAAGQLRILRAKEGAFKPNQIEVFAQGLDHPFGIAFYPPGAEPRWVYVANNNAVVRFAYQAGDLKARGAPETIVPKLSGSAGGHTTRDVVFSQDGQRMFVSVGSESNVAEGMAKHPPTDLPSWEKAHGLGAAWGEEERRADVLVFSPDGQNGRIFATGLRNCVGLAVNPGNGDVWCSTNERDGLGDNLVPDYLTRVREGAYYGWPWYYLGNHEDPRLKSERPDLAGKATVPDVLLQPHSASLGMVFYDGSMFPAEYRGSAFAAFHGSWNRSSRTGYKVVRAILNNGAPTGEYEDFLTGFVADDDHVWGRPVGVAVAHDGALLVTEDGNGTLWRVSFRP